ncbi:uncharacterized protein LOC144118694 [Amblyomma americanum]
MALPVPESLLEAMAEQQLSANPYKKPASGSASPGRPGRSTAWKGSAPASPGTATPRGTGAKSPKRTAASGSPGTRSPRRASQSATPSRMASSIALRQPGNASPVRSRGIPSPTAAVKWLFGASGRSSPHDKPLPPARFGSPAKAARSGTSINPSESTAAVDASTVATTAATTGVSTETREPGSAAADHRVAATHKTPERRALDHNESARAKATDQKTAGRARATRCCDLPPEALCCFVVIALAAVITAVFIGIYIRGGRNQTGEALLASPEFIGV